MSKRIEQPITVVTQKGQPLRFHFRARSVQVGRIVDCWRETGRWWEGEDEREFYRLADTHQTHYVISCTRATQEWTLHEVCD